MSKKFTIADNHFGHDTIVPHRPFSSVDEMRDTMIARWNSVVARNDIVIHVGDLFFKGTVEECSNILDQLNGQIYLVEGNHDQLAEKLRNRFRFFGPMFEIKHEGHLIVFCHYPLRTWRNSQLGSFHVHGHEHGLSQEPPDSLSFDASVECLNYTPVSLSTVVSTLVEKSNHIE